MVTPSLLEIMTWPLLISPFWFFLSVAVTDCMHTHAVPNCNHLKFFKINFRISKKPPIQPTSFGKYLKKLRTEKQLSQRELARLSKVSHDSIRNWEGDRFMPKKESLAKLASFFQIDEKFLSNFDLKRPPNLLFFSCNLLPCFYLLN